MNLSIGVKQFMFSQQNQLHGQPMAFNHMRYQHGHIDGSRILMILKIKIFLWQFGHKALSGRASIKKGP